MNKWYLHCEPCGHKKIVTDEELSKIPEIKRSPIQKVVARLEDGRKVSAEFQKQTRMFKCSNCGRGVSCKKLPGVYNKSFKEEQVRKDQELDEIRKKLQEKRINEEEKNLSSGREAGVDGSPLQGETPPRTER